MSSPDEANLVIDAAPPRRLAARTTGCSASTPTRGGKGTIILVQGWNWYSGADAAAVGRDQYDFQTVVTHELGHALGLGHNVDTSSVMNADLVPAYAKTDHDRGGSEHPRRGRRRR